MATRANSWTDLLERAAVFFVLLTAAAILVLAPALRTNENARYSAMHDQLADDVSAACQAVGRDYFEATNDLAVIAHLPYMRRYLDDPSPENTEDALEVFSLYERQYGRYDRIRYLNSSGNEVLRVDYANGTPTRVSASNLRNESLLHYFTETMGIASGEIYVSPMTLIAEDGTVAVPHKPMVQLATPVFGGDGARKGIIVLDVRGSVAIKHFTKAMQANPGSGALLLNSDGHFLLSDHPADEWGFALGHSSATFESRFPEAWQTIGGGGKGSVRTAQGLFIYEAFDPLNVADSGAAAGQRAQVITENQPEVQHRWTAVLWLPPEYLRAGSLLYQPNTWVTGALILLGIGGMSLGLGYASLRRSEQRILEARIAEQAERLARTDYLTGIANRRAFSEIAEHELAQSGRYNDPLSVLAIDLDDFKIINDSYGHGVGDQVLQNFASVLAETLREVDVVARVGGDEFGVLLPQTSLEAAHEVAERLREVVIARPLALPDELSVPLTISVGVATWTSETSTLEELLARADAHLYEAKARGRNAVVA